MVLKGRGFPFISQEAWRIFKRLSPLPSHPPPTHPAPLHFKSPSETRFGLWVWMIPVAGLTVSETLVPSFPEDVIGPHV